MIRFWTSAPGHVLQRAVAPALRRLSSPLHRSHAVSPDEGRLVPKPGEVVLVMGPEALALLQKASVCPKGRAVGSLRERLWQASAAEGHYLITYDPGLPEVDPGRQVDLEWDVTLAHRFLTTGSLKAKLGEYRWVPDFSEIIAEIEAKHAETGKPVPVAFDTETLGLSPFIAGGKLICLGFTMKAGFADCLHLSDIEGDEHAKRVHSQVEWLLTSPKIKIRAANKKFDLLWLKVLWGIDCTNSGMDTLLVGSMLDENRSNSLETHTKVYVPELGGYSSEFDREIDKSRMDLVPKEKMLPYLGGDVDATFRVAEIMARELVEQPRLANLYIKVVHSASASFQAMEEEGLLVDQEAYAELRSDLVTEIAKLEGAALALLPYRLRLKYSDNLSLTRSAILKDYFFTPMGLNLKPKMLTGKTGEPSTARSHLEMFDTTPEAQRMCALLAELGQARKTLSTYVDGFLNHLRADGKFHPTFLLHAGQAFEHDDEDGGTSTGRLAAKAPAIQTVPKKTAWGKRIRKCIIAPPGHIILADDYEQGELKIAACLAGEPTMLAAYTAGIDLHAMTGSGLAEMPIEEFLKLKETEPDKFDLLRTRAKPANFGLLYGMGPEGFQAYAWAAYRLRLTLEEATKIHSAFFSKYAGLLPWYDSIRAFARKHGYVVSPMGRVRRLPQINSWRRDLQAEAERQAINAGVQSLLSEMLVYSVNLSREAIPHYRPIATIHDQVLAVVPEDRGEETAKRVCEIMSSLPLEKEFGFSAQLTFTADAEIGQSLGTMKKLKFA